MKTLALVLAVFIPLGAIVFLAKLVVRSLGTHVGKVERLITELFIVHPGHRLGNLGLNDIITSGYFPPRHCVFRIHVISSRRVGLNPFGELRKRLLTFGIFATTPSA
jgi:hypothetical protein